MKSHFSVTIAIYGVLASTASGASRLVIAADAQWKFLPGDPAGAENRSVDDGAWRTVNLPHDWSIEGHPDKGSATGAGGGYFPAGVGWYRKTFTAPREWKDRRVSVEFDGVYRDATVYLNGTKLGTQPYGYTSFRFDLTPNLDFGQANVLAVRVDNSAQPNSRWYSGSGIYRHVRVVVTEATHVGHWGVFVTTKAATNRAAEVAVQTRVENESAAEAGLTIETALLDRAGKAVGKAQSVVTVAAGSGTDAAQEITVANPQWWSPDAPALYRAVTRLIKDGQTVDQVVTQFGIRTLAWSADSGLVLNGKAIKLTGGSVHHDNGALGAAAFDRAEERRVELLKAAGHNAVRTAHNPPSPGFLDACDRIGLLVLDEPFDTWKASKAKFDYGRDFDEWWRRDLSAMVLRDRNHPSVVIWGIGNEIPELELERGRAMAQQVVDQVRSLDKTRPLTLAFPGSTSAPNPAAVFSLLDITGYNYNLAAHYAADHGQLPSRLMLTTESYPADAFEQWQLVKDNPFIIGEFTWTAMDYLGESGIGSWTYGTPEQAMQSEKGISMTLKNPAFTDKLFTAMANGGDIGKELMKDSANMPALAALMSLFSGYPWHAANCGDLDLTGHRKPQSYYRDILWNGGDRVYATVRLPEPEGKKIIAVGWAVYPTRPSWNWPGQEGKDLQVEVYSGAEKVRLFLNDKLIGEKPTGREQEFKATFAVPYAPGTLKAVGMRGDRAVAESVLVTAGKPARLRLMADRGTVAADGQDLSFVTVEAVDAEGRLEPNADQEVRFSISGPGGIAAVANGDGRDDASYQGDRRKLFEGRAQVIVRTSRQSGSIRVKGTADGLGDGVVTIESKAVGAHAEL